MKTRLLLLTVVVVLALAPVAALAQESPATTEGTVDVGAWDSSLSDSPDAVAEYEPDGGGPDLALILVTHQPWGELGFEGTFRHPDDQDYALDFDAAGRMVRSHTSYSSLLHRLGHDPLTDLEAATRHGRVVIHDDLDPGSVYGIDYEVLEHRTELQPAGLPNLTFAVGLREQNREGVRQSLTVSHCSACHVIAQDRPIDERTRDGGLEVTLAWARGLVRASFDHRELEQGVPSIELLYDNALQPEQLTPVFDDRLQWDSAEGPQQVDLLPDITKDILRLDTAFTDVVGFSLTAEGVWSNTRNEYTGLEADYSGFLATAARKLGRGWDVRWRGRSYSLASDQVFVDTVERPGIAGPAAGRTYRQIYGFDPDFLRRSSLNRDAVESRLDLSRRFGRKAGTLRLTWELETIDRDHYEVAAGQTRSTSNVLGASWSARPRKGLKTHLAYRHGETDHPFMLVDGQYSTLFSPKVASAFDPRSAQYYQFQDARIADTTASPSRWDEAEARGSYTRGLTTVSASYRWWDGDNDEGDLTDWSRTRQSANVTVWTTPAPTWEWHMAYAWSDQELEAPTSIPIFDG